MYIVIGGGGKVGEALAIQMLMDGHEVVVIEENEATSRNLVNRLRGRYMVIQGDCCDSAVLEEAGIRDADVFAAVTGRDDNNLVASEIARTLYQPPRIIARVNNPRNERIFSKLGVEAISSTTVIARMIEEEAMSSHMRTVMSLRNGAFALLEVEIPNSSALKVEGGVRAEDLELPPSTILVAYTREGDSDVVRGDTVIQSGDTVLVCTKSEHEAEVRRALLDL